MIAGAIDEPGPQQPYSGWLDVRGWAFALDGQPVDIIVEVEGKVVCTDVKWQPRPDVTAHFREIPAGSACGFRVRLTREGLPDVARASLVVRARLANCPEVIQEIGSSTIERHAPSEQGFDRVAYAQVWDASAQSLNRAREAVCGTSDTAEWLRSGEATAQDVRALTAMTTADDVLEIGCGAGRIGRFLAVHCRTWTGADVSAKMLEFAAESLADLPNVRFHRLSGYDLTGIADASFDIVYCPSVFMHLDEWERFRYVREARRVLRSGGRLYVDNFNLLSDEGWTLFAAVVEMDPSKRPANVSQQSTPQELEAYVTRAGFSDIQVSTRGVWVTVTARVP